MIGITGERKTEKLNIGMIKKQRQRENLKIEIKKKQRR
jgi:hypothetical protein